ncbi:Retrovirus-related Pol polyprotein from transposon opus [Durusdinium trenchii]|uniref:Retrovirus-related Pol polyprotein from transposon opus n=1 Tax=Durusdinium trenchii TaxID=1381693 RepID=A0ABP0KL94_9DINO
MSREVAGEEEGVTLLEAIRDGRVALVNSPRPSSVGTGGVSVVSLRAKLQALYDPSAGEFGAYLMRMGRIISAFQALDAAVPPGLLETVTRKAEFMIELYGEHGGLDKVRAVRFLRDKFVAYAQDETLDPRERDSSIAAIGELIEQLGGKPSSSPGKVYSTPSGAEEATVPVARGPVSGLRDVGRGQRPAPGPAPSSGPEQDGDFSLRAKLAALEMELEAMKREKAESKAGSALGSEQGLAAALAQQEGSAGGTNKGAPGSSVTAVKTDLHWPTLTDERSDFKDVTLFYEEFEDVCALANSCRGMNAREKLLALRARCRGSRLKTYQNLYRSAWKSGEVLEDPEAVYERIKSKHLMFSESREEREIRVDAEHVALMKGKLTGHQFEPLFEASVAELEADTFGGIEVILPKGTALEEAEPPH